jgi:hypothetical protein
LCGVACKTVSPRSDRLRERHAAVKGCIMGSQRALKEAAVFSGITLGLSCFVFWGPIAVLRIPTISFVSNVRGPVWAIVLFLLGGFVPSVVAMVLTRITEGKSGLASLLRRAIQVDLGWRWYAVAVLLVLSVPLDRSRSMRSGGIPSMHPSTSPNSRPSCR